MPSVATSFSRKLEGGVLLAVRAAWLAVAVGLVPLVTVGFVRGLHDPKLLAIQPLWELFRALNLNPRLMIALALVTPYVVVVMIGTVVFVRRSDDPMALLFTMTLLAAYSYSSRTLLTYTDGVLGHALDAVFVVMVVCFGLVFALFPDGRYVPRSARWLAPAFVALVVAFPDAGRMLMVLIEGEAEVGGGSRALVVLFSGCLLAGMAAQVYRYRRVSGATERQQAKWVMAPLGVVLVVIVTNLSVSAALPANAARSVGWLLLLTIPLGILLPAAVANAILRYRLYEIDRIISRTVSYALLTGLLVTVYMAAVFALQQLLRPVAGESQLAVAGATLAVAALFQPARRRIQGAVDRRFNRARYDAQRTVEAFRARLRDRLDIDELTTELVSTADAAVAPATAHVWLCRREPTGR